MATKNSVTDAEAGQKSREQPSEAKINPDNIREAFAVTQAYNCLECGKCTGICPVALTDSGFSPRLVVKKA
ncbi:MAG: hypothetical protein JSV49_05450, partial [Thermoplasmata archaeon]